MIKRELRVHTINYGLFEGFLILGLDPKWISVFGGKLTFFAFVDECGRLNIRSEQRVQKRK